jgi:hypothetical protein
LPQVTPVLLSVAEKQKRRLLNGAKSTKSALIEWLTDEHWIVLSFHGEFADHLEQLYFTPGTPKNDELEIMVALVKIIWSFQVKSMSSENL